MNRTIYVIEGLGGEVGAWCRSPIIKAGFTVKWFPWWWPNPKIPPGSILVGHSFGGGKAIRLVNEGKVNPSALITLDPRLEPQGGFRLKSILHIDRTQNFFQPKGLRGYFVSQMWNEEILDGTRHTQLPSHPRVIERLKEIAELA